MASDSDKPPDATGEPPKPKSVFDSGWSELLGDEDAPQKVPRPTFSPPTREIRNSTTTNSVSGAFGGPPTPPAPALTIPSAPARSSVAPPSVSAPPSVPAPAVGAREVAPPVPVPTPAQADPRSGTPASSSTDAAAPSEPGASSADAEASKAEASSTSAEAPSEPGASSADAEASKAEASSTEASSPKASTAEAASSPDASSPKLASSADAAGSDARPSSAAEGTAASASSSSRGRVSVGSPESSGARRARLSLVRDEGEPSPAQPSPAQSSPAQSGPATVSEAAREPEGPNQTELAEMLEHDQRPTSKRGLLLVVGVVAVIAAVVVLSRGEGEGPEPRARQTPGAAQADTAPADPQADPSETPPRQADPRPPSRSEAGTDSDTDTGDDAPAEGPKPLPTAAAGDPRAPSVIPRGTPEDNAKAFAKLPVSIHDGPPLGAIGRSGIHIDAVEVGKDYQGGDCVPASQRYSIAADELVNVCFRVVHPREEETVWVYWEKDGLLTRRGKVRIRDIHAYKTRAYLKLRPEYVGDWRVRIVPEDEDDIDLVVAEFQISE
ncbi:DUF2914 domain-containing protein [Pseudenhygromyxa sp. WMMC2535]|uniref:DUF2914 domain-containing protein n=1 Tax=Pseudenhygromyxa sp. WMMC2535 TaxID=2712867 RepID=UPI001556750C|nr:DUF2914 domain-containing protein [Pseudenhygromyxa sp. WMMC2535]NVB37957.1 DUF2914 domain-containing protein [Pseudenhygromyxa sp. WMMC2535]